MISWILHAFRLIVHAAMGMYRNRSLKNVVGTHLRAGECHSCSDHILTSFVICYWTDARQLAIYLLTWLKFPKWYDINLVKYWEYPRLFCSPLRQHTTVSSDTRDLKQSRRQRHPRHRSKKNEFLFLVRISQMAGRVYHLLSCLTSTPA